MKNPMKTMTRTLAGSLVATALALTSAAHIGAQQPAGQPQGGQPPAPPQNLQVLPKDMPRPELTATMRSFSQALGVECSHCHVTEPRDFASDAKQTKKTARVMMQMTMHVNEMLASGVGKPAAEVTKVQCVTCHRGKAIPETPPPAPPATAAQAAPQSPRQ
ncbi:MAG: c-type cytochrome [Vicinamibacterales bacterium]